MQQRPGGGAGATVLILLSVAALLVAVRACGPAQRTVGNAPVAVVLAAEIVAEPEPIPTLPPIQTLLPSPTPRPTPTEVPSPTPTATASTIAAVTPVAYPPRDERLIMAGRPETGVVAVTMDAGGRDPGRTVEVLDTLSRFGVRATIYLTGEWSEANPALVARMAAEGHELGNHTFDHPRLPQIGEREMLSQIRRTEETVRRLAGRELVKDVRPPFGDYDGRVLAALGARGYRVVYWTIDSGDWRPEVTSAEMVARIGARATAGDVIVFHVYAPKTAEALPGILEAWQTRGLRAGTLGEALGR